MRFKNKNVVITGGTSGIGLATVKAFSDEGASVMVCGRNSTALDKVRNELPENAMVEQADVSNLGDIERFYQLIADRYGKIDVLFANAGDVKFLPMEAVDEATFDYVTSNSFKATFFTIQKAIPHLNDNASVIVMSATGQSLGFPGSTIAAANKAAIRSLARGVSADLLSTRGIRVNCISPGPIDTPLYDKLDFPAEQVEIIKQQLKMRVPLKRMGNANEVARLALFLGSDESSYIVGEEIKIGGGEGNFLL